MLCKVSCIQWFSQILKQQNAVDWQCSAYGMRHEKFATFGSEQLAAVSYFMTGCSVCCMLLNKNLIQCHVTLYDCIVLGFDMTLARLGSNLATGLFEHLVFCSPPLIPSAAGCHSVLQVC